MQPVEDLLGETQLIISIKKKCYSRFKNVNPDERRNRREVEFNFFGPPRRTNFAIALPLVSMSEFWISKMRSVYFHDLMLVEECSSVWGPEERENKFRDDLNVFRKIIGRKITANYYYSWGGYMEEPYFNILKVKNTMKRSKKFFL